MTATTHALVGAAIVNRFPHLGGLVLALLSHLPLDSIPHWDTIDGRQRQSLFFKLTTTALDVIFGLVLAWFFFNQTTSPLILLAGVFSAQLPDWLSAPYFFFKIDIFFSRQVREIQLKHHRKTDLPWGIITQIIVILLTFFLLGIIPRR